MLVNVFESKNHTFFAGNNSNVVIPLEAGVQEVNDEFGQYLINKAQAEVTGEILDDSEPKIITPKKAKKKRSKSKAKVIQVSTNPSVKEAIKVDTSNSL